MSGVHTEIIQFGILGTITGKPNLTQYMPPGAGNTTTNEVALRVTRAGVLRNLYIQQRVSNGAGVTNTFTVRKNGVDTALSAAITNGTQGEDTSNEVSVAAGDQISLKLVTSTTNPSEDIIATLELDHGDHYPSRMFSAQH